MLTGRRAFEGEDVSDVLAAVLRGEPDWIALSKDLPHTIGVLVRRRLEKDRRRRIGDISTATLLLNEPLAAPMSSPVAAAPVKAFSRAAWIVAAVLLAAIAGARWRVRRVEGAPSAASVNGHAIPADDWRGPGIFSAVWSGHPSAPLRL